MKFTTDVVIGLEIHVELATDTKLFCSCSTHSDDKDEKPNSRTCPVCLGHPGSKPVLNKKAVEYSLKLALALGCRIAPELVFSRKSYFYPDLAKNYQISQYEMPLGEKGTLKLSSGKKIGITRVHIEEDPASLIHPAGINGSNYVLVDYNRSGDPLCEVVTEPDMESPEEAREFMKKLISILRYLDIFDINRCIIKADANISIKESGYIRAEIKNITGFRDIERALKYEIERQKADVAEGKNILNETRGWDSQYGVTRSMRLKETEADYGYIIDPDLVPIMVGEDWVSEVKDSLPELPDEKVLRFMENFRLERHDAEVIAADKEIAHMLESVSKDIDPVLAAKWIRRELVRCLNYVKKDLREINISAKHIKDLLSLIEQKRITERTGQKLMEQLVAEPFDVIAYVKKEGLEAVSDSNELEAFCKKSIEDNPKAVEDYLGGNENSLNFLIGQVMRMTKGKATPDAVKEIILNLLSKR